MSRPAQIAFANVVVTVISAVGAGGAMFLTTFGACFKERDPSPLCDAELSLPLVLGAAAVPLAVGVLTTVQGLRDGDSSKAYRPLIAGLATGVLGAVAFALTG